MKITAVLLGFFVLGFYGCQNGTPSGAGDMPVIDTRPVVCFGDSLTEGYGASEPDRPDKSQSYPAFLREKLTVAVVNSGITGDTAAAARARVERDVLAHDPQLVIILLGANDFFAFKPANEIKNNLQSIIDMINDGNRKIFLASFIGDSSWEAVIRRQYPVLALVDFSSFLAGYKQIYTELESENSDVELVPDIWTGVWNIHMSDPIHPNAEGYRVMAESVFSAVKPYLEKNGAVRR